MITAYFIYSIITNALCEKQIRSALNRRLDLSTGWRILMRVIFIVIQAPTVLFIWQLIDEKNSKQ